MDGEYSQETENGEKDYLLDRDPNEDKHAGDAKGKGKGKWAELIPQDLSGKRSSRKGGRPSASGILGIVSVCIMQDHCTIRVTC